MARTLSAHRLLNGKNNHVGTKSQAPADLGHKRDWQDYQSRRDLNTDTMPISQIPNAPMSMHEEEEEEDDPYQDVIGPEMCGRLADGCEFYLEGPDPVLIAVARDHGLSVHLGTRDDVYGHRDGRCWRAVLEAAY